MNGNHKKTARVLLVQPFYPGTHFFSPYFPAGLGYLAEYLEANGQIVEVMDMGLGYKTHDLLSKIREVKPDILGMTMMTYMFKNTFKIIKAVKDENQDIAVIVGGPHVSTNREQVLKDCLEIDFGCVMEGEETLLDLCNGVPIEKIPGLIYRNGKSVKFNGQRPFISVLDNLPYPKLRRFEISKYIKKDVPFSIVSSRGCPYMCTYCPVALAIGKKFRYRSANNVSEEINYWYKQGIRQFSIIDDNFTLIKKRVLEVCHHIKALNLKGIRIMCGNGVRADKIDREVLTAMKKAGFYHLAFGVEAGNDRILKNIKKSEEMKEIERAIDLSCQLGFEVVLFFILGSPGETFEDFMDSVNIAKRYPVMNARWYNLIPYPGTELYEYCKEKNLLKSPPEEYLNSAQVWSDEPIFGSPEFPVEQRRKALSIGKKVNQELKYKYYQRRFKKYAFGGGLLAYILTRKSFSFVMTYSVYRHLSSFGKRLLNYNRV